MRRRLWDNLLSAAEVGQRHEQQQQDSDRTVSSNLKLFPPPHLRASLQESVAKGQLSISATFLLPTRPPAAEKQRNRARASNQTKNENNVSSSIRRRPRNKQFDPIQNSNTFHQLTSSFPTRSSISVMQRLRNDADAFSKTIDFNTILPHATTVPTTPERNLTRRVSKNTTPTQRKKQHLIQSSDDEDFALHIPPKRKRSHQDVIQQIDGSNIPSIGTDSTLPSDSNQVEPTHTRNNKSRRASKRRRIKDIDSESNDDNDDYIHVEPISSLHRTNEKQKPSKSNPIHSNYRSQFSQKQGSTKKFSSHLDLTSNSNKQKTRNQNSISGKEIDIVDLDSPPIRSPRQELRTRKGNLKENGQKGKNSVQHIHEDYAVSKPSGVIHRKGTQKQIEKHRAERRSSESAQFGRENATGNNFLDVYEAFDGTELLQENRTNQPSKNCAQPSDSKRRMEEDSLNSPSLSLVLKNNLEKFPARPLQKQIPLVSKRVRNSTEVQIDLTKDDNHIVSSQVIDEDDEDVIIVESHNSSTTNVGHSKNKGRRTSGGYVDKQTRRDWQLQPNFELDSPEPKSRLNRRSPPAIRNQEQDEPISIYSILCKDENGTLDVSDGLNDEGNPTDGNTKDESPKTVYNYATACKSLPSFNPPRSQPRKSLLRRSRRPTEESDHENDTQHDKPQNTRSKYSASPTLSSVPSPAPKMNTSRTVRKSLRMRSPNPNSPSTPTNSPENLSGNMRSTGADITQNQETPEHQPLLTNSSSSPKKLTRTPVRKSLPGFSPQRRSSRKSLSPIDNMKHSTSSNLPVENTIPKNTIDTSKKPHLSGTRDSSAKKRLRSRFEEHLDIKVAKRSPLSTESNDGSTGAYRFSNIIGSSTNGDLMESCLKPSDQTKEDVPVSSGTHRVNDRIHEKNDIPDMLLPFLSSPRLLSDNEHEHDVVVLPCTNRKKSRRRHVTEADISTPEQDNTGSIRRRKSQRLATSRGRRIIDCDNDTNRDRSLSRQANDLNPHVNDPVQVDLTNSFLQREQEASKVLNNNTEVTGPQRRHRIESTNQTGESQQELDKPDTGLETQDFDILKSRTVEGMPTRLVPSIPMINNTSVDHSNDLNETINAEPNTIDVDLEMNRNKSSENNCNDGKGSNLSESRNRGTRKFVFQPTSNRRRNRIRPNSIEPNIDLRLRIRSFPQNPETNGSGADVTNLEHQRRGTEFSKTSANPVEEVSDDTANETGISSSPKKSSQPRDQCDLSPIPFRIKRLMPKPPSSPFQFVRTNNTLLKSHFEPLFRAPNNVPRDLAKSPSTTIAPFQPRMSKSNSQSLYQTLTPPLDTRHTVNLHSYPKSSEHVQPSERRCSSAPPQVFNDQQTLGDPKGLPNFELQPAATRPTEQSGNKKPIPRSDVCKHSSRPPLFASLKSVVDKTETPSSLPSENAAGVSDVPSSHELNSKKTSLSKVTHQKEVSPRNTFGESSERKAAYSCQGSAHPPQQQAQLFETDFLCSSPVRKRKLSSLDQFRLSSPVREMPPNGKPYLLPNNMNISPRSELSHPHGSAPLYALQHGQKFASPGYLMLLPSRPHSKVPNDTKAILLGHGNSDEKHKHNLHGLKSPTNPYRPRLLTRSGISTHSKTKDSALVSEPKDERTRASPKQLPHQLDRTDISSKSCPQDKKDDSRTTSRSIPSSPIRTKSPSHPKTVSPSKNLRTKNISSHCPLQVVPPLTQIDRNEQKPTNEDETNSRVKAGTEVTTAENKDRQTTEAIIKPSAKLTDGMNSESIKDDTISKQAGFREESQEIEQDGSIQKKTESSFVPPLLWHFRIAGRNCESSPRIPVKSRFSKISSPPRKSRFSKISSPPRKSRFSKISPSSTEDSLSTKGCDVKSSSDKEKQFENDVYDEQKEDNVNYTKSETTDKHSNLVVNESGKSNEKNVDEKNNGVNDISVGESDKGQRSAETPSTLASIYIRLRIRPA